MKFNVFMRSQSIILAIETGPERDPNRIFDAEPHGKLFESLLERSWMLLEPKKRSNEPLLAALRRFLERS